MSGFCVGQMRGTFMCNNPLSLHLLVVVFFFALLPPTTLSRVSLLIIGKFDQVLGASYFRVREGGSRTF